jgi:hypothetical protein
MRQHPIPQNILDVEFKLFTKFTLKEFGYLALGIGLGGVFLYLVASDNFPAVIGVPIFIISSIAGIILGLVPINDQDADLFIKNYVTAITSPTQRVWMDKDMKKKAEKPDIKPTEDGKIVQKDTKETSKKIIGGNVMGEKKEEQKDNPQDTVSAEKETVDTPKENTPAPIDPNKLVITEDNAEKYQIDIQSLDKLPGTINLWLTTKDLKQIPNVISYLRDSNGKIVYANKTGPNGYFLTNKQWPEGIYTVDFQHPQFKFPKVELVLTKNFTKKPIKITTI